jgi:hypothetical protein
VANHIKNKPSPHPLLHKLKIELVRRPFFKVVGEEDEGRSQRAVANGRAMLAPNGAVGHDGCVRYEEGACLLEARVGHTQVQLC